MNIMSVGMFDAAGVQTTFAEAWTKYGYGEWRTFFVNNYMDLPVDINHSIPFDEMLNIINDTDIFLINVVIDKGETSSHLINDWDTIGLQQDKSLYLLFPYIKETGKPIIFYINGSNCVRKWSPLYEQIFNQITPYTAVSTPDLIDYFPKAVYFPGFIDIEKPFWNLPPLKKDYLWVGQFPTNPAIKNTKEFISIMSELSHLNIKVDIINGVPHSQSINYRRDMDITFDHLGGYYGINSLESAALGIVNIVKLNDKVKERFNNVAGTDVVPWDLVNSIDDVKALIEYYYNNPEELKLRKESSKKWMHKYWHPKKHLDRMEKYFNEITKNNN